MNAFRIAWRNLWRNSRRTAITIAAIGLNAAILIASYGLMEGILKHTISNATNIVVGEVQIHAPKYLVDHSLYKSLRDPDTILKRLKENNIPVAPRSYGFGLVACDNKSSGALFWGVNPEMEKAGFDLARHLAQGHYLTSKPNRELILGRKLARSLHATIGSEIVAVVQCADGSLGNELYRVSGILKAAGDSIDRNAAILHRYDFEELFVSNGRIHEIALNSKGSVPLDKLAAVAADAAPRAEVKSWRQLMPSLSDMVNLFDASIWLFGMIFFLAAALGVMNTMLMATFERIREFGILKALGTTPWRILRDVTAEAFVLSLVSTVIGILVGLALSYYLKEIGLDTTIFISGDSSVSIAGVAFDPIWRATISMKTVLMPVLVMWAVCVIASIYPATIAARIDPVRAMTRI